MAPVSDAAGPTDVVSRNLLFCVLGAAGWTALEWVRGWFLLGGFGWNGLGVSQWQIVPLFQFATVTGVYGVSALLCLVNGAFFFTARRFIWQLTARVPIRRLSWEFYVAVMLACLAFIQGVQTVRRGEPARVLRLALVQGNIPQTLKFEPSQKSAILQTYADWTRRVIIGQPDLVIWPETATPLALRYDKESFELAKGLAAEAGAPLLTGTIDLASLNGREEAFNAAALVLPDGRLAGMYHKVHLVPFGEYVPLRKLFPFMKYLTPIDGSFERGREFTVFEIDRGTEGWKIGRMEDGKGKTVDDAGSQSSNLPVFHSSAALRFGVVICFEDTVPALYRRFVARGVDFMVNLTNDGWFKESPAAELQLANAVFRAVETRVPLVRVTNNGVTCLVDQFGFADPRRRLAPFVEGSLLCELELPPAAPPTFYTQHGDVFARGCAAVSLTALGVGYVAARRGRLPAPA